MSSKKLPRQVARGWLLWLTVQDSPVEGEPYFTENQIGDMVKSALEPFSGIRVTRLRVQPLPRAERRGKTPGKPEESGI